MVKTVCKVCGSVFEAKRKGAMYCSNACKQKAKRGGAFAPVWPDTPPDVSVQASVVECQASLQEAHRLANDFARYSKTAPYQMRARFARLSRALAGALDAEGL